jgi:hypothetical protein
MAEEKGTAVGRGTLTGESLEAEDVLAGAEEWSSTETWLVVGSFIAAVIALVIGLLVVPTSVLR